MAYIASSPRCNVRGALVGFGFIASGHLAGFAAAGGFEIVAVVDPVEHRRRAARRVLPNVATFASLEDLPLNQIDFLDICSPPIDHFKGISFALQSDLPVICEKPLVLGTDDALALARLETSSRGFLYPCHNYRFAPSMVALMNILDRHRDRSQPLTGHFRTLRTGHAKGVADWKPDWRRIRSISGGGILRDHGPHSIYLATAMTGSAPTHVRCDLRYSKDGPYGDTEEYVFLDVAFVDGSTVSCELDWAASVRQTSYLVSGSWGHARIIDDSLEWCARGRAENFQIPSDFNDPSHGSWFRPVWDEFRDALVDRAIAKRLLVQAYATVGVIDAAYASAARRGEWIDVVV